MKIMVFSLNFCIIKRVIYSNQKGDTSLKKILILSLLTVAIIVGAATNEETTKQNELATTDNAYSTYGITEDPGGGGI
jgi:nitrate reductase gamma subunit